MVVLKALRPAVWVDFCFGGIQIGIWYNTAKDELQQVMSPGAITAFYLTVAMMMHYGALIKERAPNAPLLRSECVATSNV
jgi:hypothetical protein